MGTEVRPREPEGQVPQPEGQVPQREGQVRQPDGPPRPRPIVLVIVDGFGLGSDPASDAIAAARMPVWRSLLERWPHARLEASGEAVGLPPGQMGNSEVGHLNIGAGRPVLQDLPRIDAAIDDGSFFERPAFQEAARTARETSGRLNVVGLVGPGGVHAHDRHLVALAELARREQVPAFRLHALLDGRDTAPRSALDYVSALEARLAQAHPNARIASVGGRYFAMDRDGRWDRTKAGYDAIVHGVGEHAPSATAAIEASYSRGIADEFVVPTIIDPWDGPSSGPLVDGEPIVVANFRADRARQLVHALADADFEAFDRAAPSGRAAPTDLSVVTMTEYEAGLPVRVAFPPEVVPCLAGAIADAGWRQLHLAETEKYAHVTYFLNGGRETPFEGEDRVLVPSPKVATYDLQPEMSAPGVADALVGAIASGEYDVLIANFANPDMVGHTGHWDATIRAVEAVDAALGRIVAALGLGGGDVPLPAAERASPYSAASAPSPAPSPTPSPAPSPAPGSNPSVPTGALLVVTADHGNADAMRTADGSPITAHSLNPVPLLIAGESVVGRSLRDGVLADVAPTLLELAALRPWPGITGRSLLRD